MSADRTRKKSYDCKIFLSSFRCFNVKQVGFFLACELKPFENNLKPPMLCVMSMWQVSVTKYFIPAVSISAIQFVMNRKSFIATIARLSSLYVTLMPDDFKQNSKSPRNWKFALNPMIMSLDLIDEAKLCKNFFSVSVLNWF